VVGPAEGACGGAFSAGAVEPAGGVCGGVFSAGLLGLAGGACEGAAGGCVACGAGAAGCWADARTPRVRMAAAASARTAKPVEDPKAPRPRTGALRHSISRIIRCVRN
jgi:hypothetical protein